MRKEIEIFPTLSPTEKPSKSRFGKENFKIKPRENFFPIILMLKMCQGMAW